MDPTQVTRTRLLLAVLAKTGSRLDRLGKSQWLFAHMAAFTNDPHQKSKALARHAPSARDAIVATDAKGGTNFEHVQSREDPFVPPVFSARWKVTFRRGKAGLQRAQSKGGAGS